jgi:hypothetical protein
MSVGDGLGVGGVVAAAAGCVVGVKVAVASRVGTGVDVAGTAVSVAVASNTATSVAPVAGGVHALGLWISAGSPHATARTASAVNTITSTMRRYMVLIYRILLGFSFGELKYTTKTPRGWKPV